VKIGVLDVQLAEAHNRDAELALPAEGLRLSQLSNPSRAGAYAFFADRRFASGEWHA
jgi:hypothetical protein